MQKYQLEVKERTEKGEKVRDIKTIPAVLYGAGEDNKSVSLSYKDFVDLYQKAGSSSLIDLSVNDKEAGKVLVQDIQYDPVSNNILHIDFKRIEMNKEMEAPVVLNFIGEALAVKEQGGTLVKNLEEVTVRCLPKDLLAEIEVDLTVLATFDDVIKVKDLIIPETVKVISPSLEDMVAKAIPALSEEELKAMEEAGSDVGEVEVAGEKKEEGEEAGDEKDGAKPEEKKEDKKEEDKK
jgi:large subunit ribosomal protein L25